MRNGICRNVCIQRQCLFDRHAEIFLFDTARTILNFHAYIIICCLCRLYGYGIILLKILFCRPFGLSFLLVVESIFIFTCTARSVCMGCYSLTQCNNICRDSGKILQFNRYRNINDFTLTIQGESAVIVHRIFFFEIFINYLYLFNGQYFCICILIFNHDRPCIIAESIGCYIGNDIVKVKSHSAIGIFITSAEIYFFFFLDTLRTVRGDLKLFHSLVNFTFRRDGQAIFGTSARIKRIRKKNTRTVIFFTADGDTRHTENGFNSVSELHCTAYGRYFIK